VIDRARDDMRRRDAAWDELRERRVLGRIEAELDVRTAGRPRTMWLAVAAAVAAAIVLALVLRPRAAEMTPALASVELPAQAGTLALADGSRAMLHEGARVEVRVASATEIRLEQLGGRVRYDVQPGLPRAFSVVADGIEVHVVGTAFWIEPDATHVRVAVEHGRVRVARVDGSTVAELGPGEEVRAEAGVVARHEPVVLPEPREWVEIDADQTPARERRRGATKPTVRPDAPRETKATAAELQALADEARARGDGAAAADALRTLVETHPKDARVYGALFQLAKVERSRGRHAAAAAAFAAVVARDPNGALAEDARAEAAASWASAGRDTQARAAAEQYLARHPGGAHASRMQRLLQRLH